MTKSSFDLYDYWQTVNAFGHIYTGEKSRFDELLMRKRKAELCALLHKVIQNELDEQDRLLIRLHWYQGKSADELAALLHLDRSSVYRRIERITDTLFEKMKYALCYRYDNDFAQTAERLLGSDLQKELQSQQTAGGTLRRCRKQMFLSQRELGALLGLSDTRVALLENNAESMTVGELRKFMTLYGMSADALLFGDAERG